MAKAWPRPGSARCVRLPPSSTAACRNASHGGVFGSIVEMFFRFGTLLRYIFDDSITPYSRVKRASKKASDPL